MLSLFSVGAVAQTGYFSSGDLVMDRKSCESPQKTKQLVVQLDDVADDVDWIVRRIDSSAAATSCPLRPTFGKIIARSNRSPEAFKMSDLVLTIDIENQLLSDGTSTCTNLAAKEKGLLCLYAKEKEGNQIVLVAETNYMLGLTARTVAASGVLPRVELGVKNVAALEWELDRKGSKVMTSSEALSYCTSLGAGWRLPTIWELYTLYQQKSVLNGDYDPHFYWSSSPCAPSSVSAWVLYFRDGWVYALGVNNDFCVRCCR